MAFDPSTATLVDADAPLQFDPGSAVPVEVHRNIQLGFGDPYLLTGPSPNLTATETVTDERQPPTARENAPRFDPSSAQPVQPLETPGAPAPGADVRTAAAPPGKVRFGTATTFGLNPNGSVDRQDNGQGAPRLGRVNTRDPNLMGVAVPEETLRAELGNDPAAWRRARVQVFNEAGQQITVPIVDLGPGKSTGNAIDLTYAATKALNTHGKAQVGYRILPDAGGDHMTTPGTNGFSDFVGRAFVHGVGQIDRALEGGARAAGAQGVADWFKNYADLRQRQESGVDPSAEGVIDPARSDTTEAKFARGTGDVLAMVPGIAAGGIPGLVTMGLQGAGQASADAHDQVLANGGTDAEATHAAGTAVVKTLPYLAAYALTGKLGGAAISKLLPVTATPLVRAAATVGAQAPLNMLASEGTAAGMHAAGLADEGADFGNIEHRFTDLAFALHGGKGGWDAAKHVPTAQAVAEGTHPEIAVLRSMAAQGTPFPDHIKAEAARQADAMQAGAQTFLESMGTPKRGIESVKLDPAQFDPSTATPLAIERTPGLPADEAAAQHGFASRIEQDPDTMAALYRAQFGPQLNADKAMELSPDYNAGPEARAKYAGALHGAAAHLIDHMFAQEIAQPLDPEKPIVAMTAGGAASGKSAVLSDAIQSPRTAFTLDTTLSRHDRARAQVKAALDTGREVQINRVYRPFEDAVNSALQRSLDPRNGRVVGVDTLAQTHWGAEDTVRKLHAEFAKNPNFSIRFFQNDRPGEPPRRITDEEAAAQPHPGIDELTKTAQSILDGRLADQSISRELYEKAKSRNAGTPGVDGRNPQGEVPQAEGAGGQGGPRGPVSADQGELKFRLKNGNESGSVPLSLIQDAVDFGAKIYRAGMSFARWSAEMLRQLGDAVKPHLVRLWESMQSERGSAGGGGGLDIKGERTDTREARMEPTPEAAAETPEKRRKFIQSVKDSEQIQPEVKDIAESVYTPITNKATVEAANARINEVGVDTALREVMDANAKTNPPTARTYAQGIELMGRLQKTGRFEEAARLAEHIAENSTTQGQAIQALSLLSKLTPEGIQVYAARVADKATRADPATQRLRDEITRLRGELQKARGGHATRAIQLPGMQERLAKLFGNPGSLWGRYKDSAVKSLAAKLLPQSRAQSPALEVFTKRLVRNLQEKLPKGELAADKTKATPPDEAALIGEAVRNFDKYKQVWEEAQATVRDRFKDHPEALESLDAYLGQILDKPFSDRSAGRAVRQELQNLQLNLRDILTRSAGDQEAIRQQLVNEITSRSRTTGDEAATIAKAVQEEFNRQAGEARGSLLKQMLRVSKPGDRVPKTQLQRLMELNNAGALDDAKLHDELSQKLGVPTWTPELSRKVQALQQEYEQARDPAIKLIKGAEMLDAVHSIVPPSTWQKVRGLQQIAMLLNVKTVAKIALSHGAQGVFDTFVDSVNAYAVDPLVSVVTGRRSTTTAALGQRFHGLTAPVRDFQLGFGYAKEHGSPHPFRDGAKTMLQLAKLVNGGIMDATQIKAIHSNVFSSPFMRLLEDATSFAHGVPYRGFHQAAYLSALHDELSTARRNGESTVAPTPEMMERAMLRASRAIFMDQNFVSDAMKDLQRTMNLRKPFGLGSLTLPFSQVPGALVYRAGEHTPLGFIKAAYEFYKPGLDLVQRQRAVIDSFTRALTGSAVIATGYWLGRLGILSSAREDDQDVEAMREASGLGAYRVNISAYKRALLSGNWRTPQKDLPGDVLTSYGWLEPGAIAVAMGAQYAHDEIQAGRDLRRGKLAQMPANMLLAIFGGVKALEEQPLLSGIARLGRNIGGQQDGRHGIMSAIAKTVLDAPGNFVPTLVSQARQWQDDTVRETRGGNFMEQEINKAIAKLPMIASNRFPPSYDSFGQAKERYDYPEHTLFNVFANPAMISHVKDDPAAAEVLRVFAATGEAAAVPKVVQRSVTIHVADASGQLKPQKLELTNEQLADYQKFAGTMTHRAFLRLAASPQFARIPDEAKAMIMSRVIAASGMAAKVAILHDIPAR